jgi:hypothetical protein
LCHFVVADVIGEAGTQVLLPAHLADINNWLRIVDLEDPKAKK